MSDSKEFLRSFVSWARTLGLQSFETCDGKFPAELTPLFQGPGLKSLWKYLMENVRDKQTVLKVIKNLQLRSLRTEIRDTDYTCAKTIKELQEINSTIYQLEEKVKQRRSVCKLSVVSAANQQQDLSSMQIKRTFYEAHKIKLSSQTKIISDTQKQLHEVCQERSKKCENVTDEVGQNFLSCCSEIKKLILHLNKQHGNTLKRRDAQCTDLWKMSFHTLSLYPAKMIVNALISITKQDIEKIAKSKEDNAEHPVEAVVEDNPIAALQALMKKHYHESLCELQEAAANENSVSKTEAGISQLIKQLHQQMSSSPNAQQMQELLKTEVELKGKDAYLHSLEQSIQTLQSELESDALVQKQLDKMQQKVKNFDKDLMRNRFEIMETTKQNYDLRTNLQNYQAATIDLARSSLGIEQPELSHLCTLLQSALKEEISALDSADVSQLFTVNINLKSIPIYDLSIHRPSKTKYECGGEAYQRISSLLGINTVKSPSDLLRDVQLKIETNSMLESLRRHNQHIIDQGNDKVKEIEGIRSLVESGKHQHQDKMKTLISQGEKWMQCLQEEEKKLEIALMDWYDQPAQHMAPWLRVDDMDLASWKQAKLA